MRARVWLALAAVAVAIPLTLATHAPPAHADTPCTAADGPTTTVAPDPGAGPVDDMQNGQCSGFMSTLLPGGDPGQFPTSHYDIGYDQGGNCVCSSRRLTGWLTDFAFGFDRWFVQVGLAVVNWALGFHIADALQNTALNVANEYQLRVIGPIGLGQLFLFICVMWGGFLAFTGRLGRGLSEVGISLLIGALTASIWWSPANALMGMAHFTIGMSNDVAAVSAGQPSGSDSNVGAPILAAIHHSFIERPHEIINWGRPIPAGDPCRGVYEQYVASGPWSTSSKPRVAMKDAGCKAEDAFNRDPTNLRLGAAFLTALAGALVMVLLIMVSATYITAQLGILVAIAMAPFGLLFGSLPGRGRSLFWRWVASAGMALAGVLMMSLLLSLTLVTVNMLLGSTLDAPLLVQMGLVDLVVVMAIVKRGRLVSGGRKAVATFAQRMSGGGSGASGGSWARSAAGGVAGGFGAAEAFRWADSQRRHASASRQRNRAVDGAQGTQAESVEHLRNMAEHFDAEATASAAFRETSAAAADATAEATQEAAGHLQTLVDAFDDARR